MEVKETLGNKMPGSVELVRKLNAKTPAFKRKHGHYYKNVSHLNEIDIHRLLKLYEVTEPCVQHCIKKLLCAGIRGIKDFECDIKESIVLLERCLEMIGEDSNTQDEDRKSADNQTKPQVDLTKVKVQV